jgi:hypothetical protein
MGLRFNQKKSFGPSGMADVKVLAKNVRITFADGDVYDLPLDVWGKKPSGKYRVALSKAGDKVVGINPTTGTYIVKFKEFGNRLDGIPNSKIQRGGQRTGRNGATYMAEDKMVFHAQLEVQSNDEYNGLTILSILPYGFEPLSGTPFASVNVSGKRDLERIETFLRVAGYDLNKDIPYAPNVLPWLEEELKRAAKVFMVTTNADGFIDSMAEVPAALLAGMSKKKAKAK